MAPKVTSKVFIGSPPDVADWVRAFAEANNWSVSFAWVYVARVGRKAIESDAAESGTLAAGVQLPPEQAAA